MLRRCETSTRNIVECNTLIGKAKRNSLQRCPNRFKAACNENVARHVPAFQGVPYTRQFFVQLVLQQNCETIEVVGKSIKWNSAFKSKSPVRSCLEKPSLGTLRSTRHLVNKTNSRAPGCPTQTHSSVTDSVEERFTRGGGTPI